MSTTETGGELAVGLTSSANDTQTSLPTQDSVTTTSVNSLPIDALGSTTIPTVPTEDSAATLIQMSSDNPPTESNTVASSLDNVTSQTPQQSVDLVVTTPPTETDIITTADVSSLAPETIPTAAATTEALVAAPVSTSTLIPSTTSPATETSPAPVVSTAVPEIISSTVALTVTAETTTTGVLEPTTTTATPVDSTGGQTVPPVPVTMPPTPVREDSTLPSSVMTSGGTTFPEDPLSTTKSPGVAGATTSTTVTTALPGYLLLGSTGMPDWRLYLIMVSVIALALILIMLIGWIITCVCMRRNYQRKTKKLLLNSMPSYRNVDSGPQYPLTAWPTVRTPVGSGEDSVQHFAGNNEQPQGPPSPSRTAGYASIQRNRQAESDVYAAHRTSTPMAQKLPYNQSEQGWRLPTLPSEVLPSPQDQPGINTLSSFQPAGGGAGSSAWSDYNLSVGRQGLRHVPAAEEGGPPVASSLRMHPNVHRGLLAEMNAGVRLHPVPPPPPV